MGPETLLRETAPLATAPRRRLPIGAEALPAGGVHFRVWAPRHRELSIDTKGSDPLHWRPNPVAISPASCATRGAACATACVAMGGGRRGPSRGRGFTPRDRDGSRGV